MANLGEVEDHGAPRGLIPVLVRMLDARVGSTVIMRLLATSPAVALDRAYPYQNSYLTYLAQLTAQISERRHDDSQLVDFVYQRHVAIGPLPFVPMVATPDELSRLALGAVWAAFSGALLTSSPASRMYAEKYWGDVRPAIDAGLNPVIIDLVRDPRDMIASMRAFNRRHDQRLFGRPDVASEKEHLRQIVLGIALRLTEFGQDVAAPRITVRYEDLLHDLANSSRRIEELLGVELDERVVDERSTMSHHITSASAEASIGRWEQDLSDDDASFIARRLAPGMQRYGYL